MQPPSKRDITSAPPNIGDLSPAVRHHATTLRGVEPGMLEGRWATPQPVKPGRSQIVGSDDGGGGEDCAYEWQWDDRHTVTATGTQTKTLTADPVEESLTVRWHPKGRGGLPLTDEHFYVDGNVVTIPDTGRLAVGDEFSFQYQFDPCLSDATDAFDGITYVNTNYYNAPGPHPTSLALPTGTSIGDFIVLGADASSPGAVVTDPRLTQIHPNVWTGRATDLSPLLVTSAGTYMTLRVDSFQVNSEPTATAQNAGSTTPGVVPIISAAGVIVVGIAGFGLINGAVEPFSSPYIAAGAGATGKGSVSMGYWYDLAADANPAGTCNCPDTTHWTVTAIGFGS